MHTWSNRSWSPSFSLIHPPKKSLSQIQEEYHYFKRITALADTLFKNFNELK